MGTPAAMSDNDEPQTEAIDVEPLEAMMSETTRNV